MNMKLFNAVTRGDILIIILVLAVALMSYMFFSYSVFAQSAEGIEVFVDGREYATYSFDELKDKKIIEIKTDLGYNILEISDRGAKMIKTSCPDKTDIQAGTISKPGQMIICVPNKVSVTVIGNNKSKVDKVTY